MLRVLFIILAIVSVSLAIVLGDIRLYGLAAAMLIAAGVLITANMRKRHKDVPETFLHAPEQPEEDLASLGIMDIKPAKANAQDTIEYETVEVMQPAYNEETSFEENLSIQKEVEKLDDS